jgi:hypothetical protein
MPLGGQRWRQRQLLRDLASGQPVIGEPERLVVDELVEVALLNQEPRDVRPAPAGPMVAGEDHLRLAAPQRQRLVDIAAPIAGVANGGAAGRVHIVQVAGAVLGDAERALGRKVEVHLRRRLGVGRQLEHDLHAVDDVTLTGPGDADRRGHQRHRAARHRLPQPAIDMALRVDRQQRAVHIGRAPAHDVAAQHVLAHRVAQEALGRVDGRQCAFGGEHAPHAAIMVDMAMGVDDRGDRPVPEVLAIEGERGGRRLGAGQRIDNDDALRARYEGDRGQVEATDLVDAGRDLEQTMPAVQLGLSPQAGMNGVGRLPCDEAVGRQAPGMPDRRVRDRTEKAPRRADFILAVFPRQRRRCFSLRRAGRGRRAIAHPFPSSGFQANLPQR